MHRILILHRMEFIRYTLAQQLAAAGHSCVSAETEEEALGVLGSEEWDLFLTDIPVERPGAPDFMTRIEAQLHSITPYVVIANTSEIEKAIAALHRGAFDFLRMPWEHSEFLEIVRVLSSDGRTYGSAAPRKRSSRGAVEARPLNQRKADQSAPEAGPRSPVGTPDPSHATEPRSEELLEELASPSCPEITSEQEWRTYVELRREALAIREPLKSQPRSRAREEDGAVWARLAAIGAAIRSLATSLERKGYSVRVDGTRIRVKGRFTPAIGDGPSGLPPGWRFVYCPFCGDPIPKPPAGQVMELADHVEIGCGMCGKDYHGTATSATVHRRDWIRCQVSPRDPGPALARTRLDGRHRSEAEGGELGRLRMPEPREGPDGERSGITWARARRAPEEFAIERAHPRSARHRWASPLSVAVAILLGRGAPVLAEDADPWPAIEASSEDLQSLAEKLDSSFAGRLADGDWASRSGDMVLYARDPSGREEEAARLEKGLAQAGKILEAAGFDLRGDAETRVIHLRPRSGAFAVVSGTDATTIFVREPLSSTPPESAVPPKRSDGLPLLRDVLVAADLGLVQAEETALKRRFAAGPGSLSHALASRALARTTLPDGTPPWLREAIVCWAEEAAFPSAKAAPIHLCGGSAARAFAPAILFDPKGGPTPSQARLLGRVLGALAAATPDVAGRIGRISASPDRSVRSLEEAFGRPITEVLAATLKGAGSEASVSCNEAGTVLCPICRGSGKHEIACPACKGLPGVACPSCHGMPVCWSPHCVQGVQRFWEGKPTLCGLCDGEGVYLCLACAKAGKSPCKVCAGRGRATWPCLLCAGRGRVLCPQSGQLPASFGPDGKALPCPWCGSGANRIACPTCGGAGQQGCDTCHGSLRGMCPTCFGLGCKECRNRGYTDCPDCTGGRRPCDACGGKGSRALPSAECPACEGRRTCREIGAALRHVTRLRGGLTSVELKANAEMLGRAVRFLLGSGATATGEFALREFRMEPTSSAGALDAPTLFSNALLLWVLFTSGIGPDDPRMSRPWAALKVRTTSLLDGSAGAPARTQEASLALRALLAGGLGVEDPLVVGLVDRLAKAQRPGGFWADDLQSKEPGDAFQSLFALESLWLAKRRGARVPGEVWSKAQSASGKLTGSISKSKRREGWLTATDVASSAALAVLAKAGAAGDRAPRLEEIRALPSVQQALAWLDRYFDLSREPVISAGALDTLPTDSAFAAYLFAVERLCQLLSQDLLGGERWYAAGARRLRELQLSDGSFEEMGRGRMNGPGRTTACAVLFLVRATPPLTQQGTAPDGDR